MLRFSLVLIYVTLFYQYIVNGAIAFMRSAKVFKRINACRAGIRQHEVRLTTGDVLVPSAFRSGKSQE